MEEERRVGNGCGVWGVGCGEVERRGLERGDEMRSDERRGDKRI